METKYSIHDLYIEKLEAVSARSLRSMDIYKFSDHLLKRIGSIELIELSAGNSSPSFARTGADELWTLLEGQASFHWKDQREKSPTFNATHSFETNSPTRVLVPFGVEFNVSAQSNCTLIRICTHAGDLLELDAEHSSRNSGA